MIADTNANIRKILPLTDSGISPAAGDGGRWFEDKQMTVGIPENILNALGASNFPIDSDNFMVESMSLPLDSYDASDVEYNTNTPFNANMSNSGRRKNILMTIPENDNNNGLLEFETSTPIFIDINNTEPINVKNLDFRVLRKDFSEIRQSGEPAIMTILIDDK